MIPETEIAKMKERVEQNYPNTLTLATAFAAAKWDAKSLLAERSELLSKIEEQERELAAWRNSLELLVRGQAGSPIWAMWDGPPDAPIGIRFDCGDSGVVYVSEEQAKELRDAVDIHPLPAPPVMEKQGVPVVDVPKVGE